MATNKYKIQFGKDEKESPNEYNYIAVELNLTAGTDDKTGANVSFRIESGTPVGQFDMDRTTSFKSLSLEETRELVKKLNSFIETGEKFLSDY